MKKAKSDSQSFKKQRPCYKLYSKKTCTYLLSNLYKFNFFFRSYQNVPYVGLYKLFSPILLLRQVSIVNKIFSEEHNMFLDPKCKSTAFFISSLKNERLGQETCKFNSSQILIPENFDIKQVGTTWPRLLKT